MTRAYKQVFTVVFLALIFSFGKYLLMDEKIPLLKIIPKSISNDINSYSLNSLLSTVNEAEYSEPQNIEIEFAKHLFDLKVATFVDARDSAEFNLGHIQNALNISVESIDYCDEAINNLDKTNIIIVYCGGIECDLSVELSEYLVYDEGFEKVLVFEDGLSIWIENGYPINSTQLTNQPGESVNYQSFITLLLYVFLIALGVLYILIPKFRELRLHSNKHLILASKLILGIIFIYASIDKISNPLDFSNLLDNYHIIPAVFSNMIALYLPWLEMMLGLCLVFGVLLEGVTVLTIVLYGLFILLLFQAVVRGIDVHCGCFSVTGLQENTNLQLELVKRILEDILLLGLSIVLLVEIKE